MDDRRRATIEDVAEAAGVSVSTVDRIINKRGRVREATSREVLAAAERLGFYGAYLIRERLEERGTSCVLGFALIKRQSTFYPRVASALFDEARAYVGADVSCVIDFIDEVDGEAVSGKLNRLAEKADALGIICVDTPPVRRALEEIVDRGTPVFAILSDLSSNKLAAYIGTDAGQSSRTAAWMISKISKRPGKVATIIASSRYKTHSELEQGFRGFFEEAGQGFELLDTALTLGGEEQAYEYTADLLWRHSNLSGIYVAGGGVNGVIRALSDAGPDRFREVVAIGHEITENTTRALQQGTLQLVFATPVATLARTAVSAMVDAVLRPSNRPTKRMIMPFEIHTSQNIG